MDAKARLWKDGERCREAQLDQAICLNSLELLASFPPLPALHHLTLSEYNQTHFSRGYLDRAKRALAVFSIIAIRQILQSSYVSLQLSVIQGSDDWELSRIFNKFPCLFLIVQLALQPPG